LLWQQQANYCKGRRSDGRLGWSVAVNGNTAVVEQSCTVDRKRCKARLCLRPPGSRCRRSKSGRTRWPASDNFGSSVPSVRRFDRGQTPETSCESRLCFCPALMTCSRKSAGGAGAGRERFGSSVAMSDDKHHCRQTTSNAGAVTSSSARRQLFLDKSSRQTTG